MLRLPTHPNDAPRGIFASVLALPSRCAIPDQSTRLQMRVRPRRVGSSGSNLLVQDESGVSEFLRTHCLAREQEDEVENLSNVVQVIRRLLIAPPKLQSV